MFCARLNAAERRFPKWELSRTEIGRGKQIASPGFPSYLKPGSWKWQWYCGSALAAAVTKLPGLNITVFVYAQIILERVSAFRGLFCLKASIVPFCLSTKPKLPEMPPQFALVYPPIFFPSRPADQGLSSFSSIKSRIVNIWVLQAMCSLSLLFGPATAEPKQPWATGQVKEQGCASVKFYLQKPGSRQRLIWPKTGIC